MVPPRSTRRPATRAPSPTRTPSRWPWRSPTRSRWRRPPPRHADATILINNAGVLLGAAFLDSPVEEVRREFEVNFFGPLHTTRAFAPVLERNGGGHLLTIHSVLSWITFPGVEAYSAAKAALWSQTNALRLALRPRGIAVTGMHLGWADTDLAAAIQTPKNSPDTVAELALDGIEADAPEVLVDDLTRQVRTGLAADLTALYPQLASPAGDAASSR